MFNPVVKMWPHPAAHPHKPVAKKYLPWVKMVTNRPHEFGNILILAGWPCWWDRVNILLSQMPDYIPPNRVHYTCTEQYDLTVFTWSIQHTSAFGPINISPSSAPAITRTCLGRPTLKPKKAINIKLRNRIFHPNSLIQLAHLDKCEIRVISKEKTVLKFHCNST